MGARIATVRRLPVVTIAIALIPIAMVLAYRSLLAADPEPVRDDQVQYLALARGFLDRGEFTRAVPGEPFVPEPLRYPGYPLFVALLCGTVGCAHVVEAQAALLAIMVVIVVRFARSYVEPRAALAAGAIVAVFPAFSYFAALRLSETLATFLLVASSAAMAALLERPSRVRAVACGALARRARADAAVLSSVTTPTCRHSARRAVPLALARGRGSGGPGGVRPRDRPNGRLLDLELRSAVHRQPWRPGLAGILPRSNSGEPR